MILAIIAISLARPRKDPEHPNWGEWEYLPANTFGQLGFAGKGLKPTRLTAIGRLVNNGVALTFLGRWERRGKNGSMRGAKFPIALWVSEVDFPSNHGQAHRPKPDFKPLVKSGKVGV